jgi:hypothetical protein
MPLPDKPQTFYARMAHNYPLQSLEEVLLLISPPSSHGPIDHFVSEIVSTQDGSALKSTSLSDYRHISLPTVRLVTASAMQCEKQAQGAARARQRNGLTESEYLHPRCWTQDAVPQLISDALTPKSVPHSPTVTSFATTTTVAGDWRRTSPPIIVLRAKRV